MDKIVCDPDYQRSHQTCLEAACLIHIGAPNDPKECGFRSQKTATTPLSTALIATPSRIVLNQFTIKNPPYHSAKAFFNFLSMSIRVSLHSFGCSFPALNMKETSSPEPTGSIIFSMDCGNAKCVPCS